MITSNDNTINICVSLNRSSGAPHEFRYACIDVDNNIDDDRADYDVGMAYVWGDAWRYLLVIRIQISGTGFFTPDTGGGIIL